MARRSGNEITNINLYKILCNRLPTPCVSPCFTSVLLCTPWLVYWLAHWLSHWLSQLPLDLLTDSLTDSVTDSVNYPLFVIPFYVFILLYFHRFRIKSLMQFLTLQSLYIILTLYYYILRGDNWLCKNILKRSCKAKWHHKVIQMHFDSVEERVNGISRYMCGN